MTPSPLSAAVIIIGNEVLSGKVNDENTPFLTAELRTLGVRLSRVVVLEDDVTEIAEEIRRCSQRYDWVFTTGGLGPTHDDRTMEAVAAAFDCDLIQSPELLKALDNIRKGKQRSALERLTWIPEQAQLFWSEAKGQGWPTVFVKNVYIFPGVPQFLRSKFARLRKQLRAAPFITGWMYCAPRESELVESINAVDHAFEDVELGSYPQFGDSDHRVRITFDSSNRARIIAAMDQFRRLITPEAVVRERIDDATPETV